LVAIAWCAAHAPFAEPASANALGTASSAGARNEQPTQLTEGSIPTLVAPASLAFDAFRCARIEAASEEDAARVQGYAHAIDRFAQMDLLRRSAAGELAELLGPAALPEDRTRRVLRLRSVATAAFERLPEGDRRLLVAYADGVNAGLASLERPPIEYRALQAKPAPWRPEDALLVSLAMSALLNDGARVELALAEVVAALPKDLVGFLAPRRTSNDVPVVADDPTALPPLPPFPSPELVDTGDLASLQHASGRAALEGGLLAWSAFDGGLPDPMALGSNSWVVAGSRTPDGRAILANDMHLPYSMPAIWYRVSIAIAADAGGRPLALDGLSLPGAPGIIVGSNGSIAWGFTNVEGDFIDFVVVEVDPNDPARYRVPSANGDAWESFTVVEEQIVARGTEPTTLEVRATRWGPIVASTSDGRPLAMAWTALRPDGLDLGIFELLRARTVEEALDIGSRWRGPQQNLMVAGADGRIGWTIVGYLPDRVGFDGSVPTSWADGTRFWRGSWPIEERPRVVDPESGFIATANHRTLPLALAERIGRTWAPPERAGRIVELLGERTNDGRLAQIDRVRCRAIQLDVHAPSLERWRTLFVAVLERSIASRPADAADRGELAALRDHIAGWSGRAEAGDTAFPLIDGGRRQLTAAVVRSLAAAALLRGDHVHADDDRDGDRPSGAALAERAAALARLPVAEESILRLVEAHPDHLLPYVFDATDATYRPLGGRTDAPPGGPTPSARDRWDGAVVAALRTAATSLVERGGRRAGSSAKQLRIADLPTWGTVNTASFSHPLAAALPLVARTLNGPSHPQPGYWNAVRVATPSFGASNRLVVSPGLEDEGTLVTPCGQSGDPQSPHATDLHPSWRDGGTHPLRPGAPVSTIRFAPAG
jgi:penicillin amidase